MHLPHGLHFGHEGVAFLLVLTGNLLWVVTYIVVIYTGFKQKSYGIPWVAVCFNLSWEVLFGFSSLRVPGVETWISRVWFGIDLVILYLILRYGKSEEPNPAARNYFYPMVATMLLTALALEATFIISFDDSKGAVTAFGINLLMAVLFIHLRLQRPHRRGLSMIAAWTMTFGSALPALGVIVAGGPPPSSSLQNQSFLYIMFALIFLFNCAYIYLLGAQWNRVANLETARADFSVEGAQ